MEFTGMKLPGRIIIITGVCAASFAGGAIVGSCSKEPETKIEIEYRDKPVIEYKYIKVPMTYDEFRKCYESPIRISGMMDGIFLTVKAEDACKKTTQKFKLNVKQKDEKNIIQCNYVHLFSMRETMSMDIGANISYYRKIFSFNKISFGLGGGFTITNHSAGINAGLLTQF